MPPPPPPPPLARLESASSVPSELQPALSQLLSLHSQVDSALLRLDSCQSVAALTAATMEVKQRIGQLQQRIEAVRAEVERQYGQHDFGRTGDTAAMSHRSHHDSLTAASTTASVDVHSSVSVLLSRHAALASGYSVSLRQRLLQCRARLSGRSKEVRRELFESSAQPASAPVSASVLAADRRLQFTAGLQHTHTLLHSSLALSAASLDSLTASTDSLRSTQRHSATHAEAVKGGSKIITKQMQRQRTDRLLVWCGLAFFLLVCVYITNRRLRISRIIAFVTRTLIPNLHSYSGVTAKQHQQQQYEQLKQWGEHPTGELQYG